MPVATQMDIIDANGDVVTVDTTSAMLADRRGSASSPATAVVAITTATLLVAANANRKSLVIYNLSTTTYIYVGKNVGVTALTGLPLPPGGQFEDGPDPVTPEAWYGITAAGSAETRYIEVS